MKKDFKVTYYGPLTDGQKTWLQTNLDNCYINKTRQTYKVPDAPLPEAVTYTDGKQFTDYLVENFENMFLPLEFIFQHYMAMYPDNHLDMTKINLGKMLRNTNVISEGKTIRIGNNVLRGAKILGKSGNKISRF